MRKRTVLLSLAGILVVVGVAALGVIGWMVFQPGPYGFATGTPVALAEDARPSPTGVPAELAGADQPTRAAYITRMADCEACHTAKGGQPFAGGRPFVLPFGTIYTPNITPDPETGIGKWTDAQFLDAVHRGIAPDGSRYYPAFPYPSYTMLTDADALAIKAYLFALAPVKQPNRPNSFAFPFNQRWLMAIWATLFNSDTRFEPVPEQSPEWNRGAYLVEAAGHCGECHTPRNLMQAMDQRRKFAGGVAEGWNAYNISSDGVSGIGDWSVEQLTAYLAAGHATGRGVASGPMGEAVALSLSQLVPSDIQAIVTYLKSVPPVASNLPRLAGPAPATPQVAGLDNPLGQRMFEGNCASCHAWSGAGAVREQAGLTGVRAVNDPSGANVALMVLNGSGPLAATHPYMPGFGRAYSDAEVAAVANYVTARFGSEASTLTAADIARFRHLE
ncbi:cytochrome c [Ancylobacter amanitiformis]|uniref:Mono/diheme cytochrome c family protein n=1 Tax=Ancylobacter amanitiformis TaxID=217069 RepID=A0ABU0LWE2_9HYPH|nr:cytochrome c [Ancylobacter amanitiformis]MDQ0512975.1 mono/diheme cytochrome c family protein [Ancylobacter amanitiformis]